MKISQGIAAKEQMTIQALIEALVDVIGSDEDTIASINAAFRKGNQDWRSHLTAIFGKTEADRFFAMLEQEV